MCQFDVAYIDPPWKFANRRIIRKDGGRARFGMGAVNHYGVLADEIIKALPLSKVMADRSVVFCWGSYAKAKIALEAIESWGFRVSTIGFQWIKLNARVAQLPLVDKRQRGLVNALLEKDLDGFLDHLTFFGTGHWAAANSEPCWLGIRGAPALPVVDKTVSSIVYAPVSKHSAKPPEVARRIVQMFGPDCRYLEVFARLDSPGSGLPGWTATGLEYDGLDVFDALKMFASLEASDDEYTYRALAREYGESAFPLHWRSPKAGTAPVGLLC